jgi:MoxR-like ATPase
VANETGKCVLILEEINTLTPQVQKILNGVLDFRKRVEVPECETVFELAKGAKLWVVGTMNTAGYGGIYQLNEDLKSRFQILRVDYPKEEVETSIVTEYIERLGISVSGKILKGVLTLAKETRQESMDYALSTRDVVALVNAISYAGLETALQLTSGKFEDSSLATFKARVTSIFGVKL